MLHPLEVFSRAFAVMRHGSSRLCGAALAGLVLGLSMNAQVHRMEAAPAGRLESGAPPFAVIGTEGLGLSSPPTDLHLLPDGRLLIFASRQIVLGDGVRWEAFREAPTDPTLSTVRVAVDQVGQIFMGVPGGFSRVVFGEDGYWRLAPAGKWPATESPSRPVPRNVIEVNDEWFWNSGSGSVIAWRPGTVSRVAGQANMVEHMFSFRDQTYLSERTEGELYRLHGEKMELVDPGTRLTANNAVTCAVAYDEASLLVGTYGRGLQLFDGQKMRPLRQTGILAGGLRINDLCRTEGSFYAAAVESFGIVFFDQQGRTIQVLDHSLDHRLSRVKRLVPAPGGVIWALLDEGVVRVQFPARVSNFEPVIGSGVTDAHPYRLDGRLWIVADGKSYRAVYDDEDRLVRMTPDGPPEHFVFSFSTVPGLAIVGTDRGAYYRSESGWELFAPESDNLRILDPEPRNGRWIYGAKNEIGWLSVVNGKPVLERNQLPEAGNIFNTSTDNAGVVWLELGNGRVGRLKVEQDRIVPEFFDHRQGVPDGWAQVFSIGGAIGFNIADRILSFDESTKRFVPDHEFEKKYPGLTEIVGRPSLDARGRLWMTANGGVQILEKSDGGWKNLHEKMPPGLRPIFFAVESSGVVWMHADRRMTRYDPSLPLVAAVPLRAVITHVNLVTSSRTFYTTGGAALPEFDHSDNSINVHFLAPGDPFAAPVTFEVMLEGTGGDWVSTGGSGTAVFNRLKEGKYQLRVRPRSGDALGSEATLAFVIRPPWFRSAAAYSFYALGGIGAVGLAFWLTTFLQRRENTRLERLVAQRTGELNESNTRLASQVDEIQMLSQAIGQSPVGVLITQPDGTIVFSNPRMSELTGYHASELVGKNATLLQAEAIPPEVLRQLSTTLQQGESWHGQLMKRRKDGRTFAVRTSISPIRNATGQIRLHLILEEDITEWLADQDRRQRLEAQLTQSQKLESLGTLAGGIAHDFNNILTGILGYCELARLTAPPDQELQDQLKQIRAAGMRAKDLVTQILTFSRRNNTQLVPLDLAQPVDEALKLIRASTPATIEIKSSLESGTINADSTQIQQVVLNLCTNSTHAMPERAGRITITVRRLMVDSRLAAEVGNLSVGPFMCLTVADNGHGMDQATLARIFDPFFTTKRQGEGTGLGLSIVQGVIASHHGALHVQSSPGRGTTFDLYFPVSTDPIPRQSPQDETSLGSQQEILLVDDEPAVLEFATTRLRQLGYRVTALSDPRVALLAVQNAPTLYQAIVSDLTMPHLTGIQLIQKARVSAPGLAAIIITGYGHVAAGSQLAALPRSRMLQKPFSGEDLARVLHELLSGVSLVK